ncbi:M20/M25/M40 family metallo-hydrolase [Actinophytocola oryzae]|uniref:Acetylornithine deacetylase n=1 Tax=Actinophytocola oryzae TaxID=502181 RepID=A0A4R7V5H5_9PSEU|nr:M20/M25/M40 family metallo-hydrolase [Actinophytocola oryzae]TDV43205.1 acetylornithine deacetylase [Actinophytocola oryzae]
MRRDREQDRAAVRVLRDLVAIPSFSGDEGPAAEYLAGRMADLGYAVRIDAVGNVVGELGGAGGPTIMMVGHLDTVAGTLPVREVDGVLYGRGTVDAKGPLAAMVHAGARAASPAYRVVVVGAVDEEDASRGARHLPATLERPDFLLIGEPSSAAAVVVGYKGILRFDWRVRRPAAHTSSPAERAVEVAAGLWAAVCDRLDTDPAAPAFDRAIPALTALRGDLVQAYAHLSCRVPRGFESAPFLTWLRGWTDSTEVTVHEDLPAVRTSRGDPLVRTFVRAVRRVTGRANVKVKLGTSDMNVLVPAWQVPAVAYGPGDSALDHTDEERVAVEEYLTAIDVLAEALPDVAARLSTRDPAAAGTPGG